MKKHSADTIAAVKRHLRQMGPLWQARVNAFVDSLTTQQLTFLADEIDDVSIDDVLATIRAREAPQSGKRQFKRIAE